MIWVFQLRLGEALLEANDPSALVLFTQLTDAPGGDGHDGTRPDPNRVRLGLGRAQRLAGDNRSAFVTLRALADDLDQTPSAEPVRAGKNPRPDAYWGACAEMLEILALDNASGDRAPEIRLQLNRLALIDPGFGPEPWRSRILKVRDSIK
jgi:hypothetical protein